MDMMQQPHGAIARDDLVADFAASALFERTFQEGMALVEQTAAYLDGEGRRESKRLGRSTALAYAGESMRLTTRLMQIASWLLVQRAVREGDMAPGEACDGGEDACACRLQSCRCPVVAHGDDSRRCAIRIGHPVSKLRP